MFPRVRIVTKNLSCMDIPATWVRGLGAAAEASRLAEETLQKNYKRSVKKLSA
jgi:hypothetical protein